MFPYSLHVSKLCVCLLLRGGDIIVLYEYGGVWYYSILQSTLFIIIVFRLLKCCLLESLAKGLVLTSSKLADSLWEVQGIIEVCFCNGGFHRQRYSEPLLN
jgi:hypothetical protein